MQLSFRRLAVLNRRISAEAMLAARIVAGMSVGEAAHELHTACQTGLLNLLLTGVLAHRHARSANGNDKQVFSLPHLGDAEENTIVIASPIASALPFAICICNSWNAYA